MTRLFIRSLLFVVVCTSILTACDGGNSGNAVSVPPNCPESGGDPRYACRTGNTEPLYKYQWALKQAGGFFAMLGGSVADGVTDLDVEDVHKAGIKGQGINVLVLDDGIDIRNEDLIANVNKSMLYNFDNGSSDPTPADIPSLIDASHGTSVAGVIAAAQNGKGIMGIAPRVSLGGARFLTPLLSASDYVDAYGGASWSKNADLINASYGIDPQAPVPYDTSSSVETASIRSFPMLRNGKGLLMLKSAGNSFASVGGVPCPLIGKGVGVVSCANPADDTDNLEPPVIVIAAANATGVKASYSSAGPLNWITGLGGEFGNAGRYGELGTGPTLFTTDLSGCARGSSRNNISNTSDFNIAGTPTNIVSNSNCNYTTLNGTSAAAPTVSGVVALMLSANPSLTWRDVRDILRSTARKIDPDYGTRDDRDAKFDLATKAVTADTGPNLVDGATDARFDYGWQKNAAGIEYSNWYGFGLVDAAAAVSMAKSYTAHKPTVLNIPAFSKAFPDVTVLKYGHVQKLGQFVVGGNNLVDQLQIRVTGPICVGSVGIFIKSPSGTESALSLPYSSYYVNSADSATDYGLGSYAFYGEKASGTWEVYAVNGVPDQQCDNYTAASGGTTLSRPLSIEYRIIAAQ
jgi:subtilisin family serine protease